MTKTYSKTRTLVECALMIALGTVLANIKIYELPNGGSITLFSMLPFILISFRHGAKWGGAVHRLRQQPFADAAGFYAPPAPACWPLVGMILLDYVLAFTLLGLAGAIAKPFSNRLVGVAVGHCRRLRASFPLQLFVRRADLGQPQRRPARLDLQPDLQRKLHAARDDPDHGGRRADLPRQLPSCSMHSSNNTSCAPCSGRAPFLFAGVHVIKKFSPHCFDFLFFCVKFLIILTFCPISRSLFRSFDKLLKFAFFFMKNMLI